MKAFPLLEAQAILFEKGFPLSKGTKGAASGSKGDHERGAAFKRNNDSLEGVVAWGTIAATVSPTHCKA